MIRKIQIFGLALLSMFAFGVALVATASAETTLTAQWLNNGAAITANLASETAGELLLEDTKAFGAKAAVLCSGVLTGTVGVNGADEITKLLNLAKTEEITLVKPLLCSFETTCENNTDIEVSPVGLPWKTLLFLMEDGKILDLVVGSGYELSCLVLGLKVEDECKATDTELPVENSAEGDAITPAGSKAEPLATCTVGGANSGVNETEGVSTIKLVEVGTLLSVSSE